jgi:dipeptidyl aminopeptidase/acylaminoacyl peptidase
MQTLSLGDTKLRDIVWVGPDHVVVSSSVTRAVQGRTWRGELYQGVSLNVRTGEVVQLMNIVQRGQAYTNVMFSDPVPGSWDGAPVVFVEALSGGRNASGNIDVVRVEMDDGEVTTHQVGDNETYSFLVAPDGTVIARQAYDSDSRRWTAFVRRGGNWRNVYSVVAPIDIPSIAGLSADGSALLVNLWDEENQVWRPTPFSIETGAQGAPIYPPVTLGLMLDRNFRTVGYATTGIFTEYTFTRPDLVDAWRRASEALSGRQVALVSYTPDFSRMVLLVEGTGMPGNYFLYDVAAGSLTQIGRAYPGIQPEDIAEVRYISYNAGDGLEIHGYLTLPPGRAATNLPLVVLPHGGPQARDVAGFDWMAQSLASRGYAVLQPNFRGSSGYGRAFIEAGWGEFGRKMQTDVSDGVTYLANRNIIDPSRVCVMGASYGGYVALAGVTMQQGIYRCAISIAGVSDADAMLAWTVQRASSNSTSMRYWLRYLGVERAGDPRLHEISPRRAARNGDAPVLLIHGRDDLVVPYSHSTAMQEALREAGRPVELVTLRAEDHWLSREPTRIQTMQAVVAFLEEHNPPN